MNLSRRAANRDKNERWLIELLRAAGAQVHQISGRGLPDLLVGYRRRWVMVEVKNPARSWTMGPAQQQFIDAAKASGLPVYVIFTAEDAQRMLRAIA